MSLLIRSSRMLLSNGEFLLGDIRLAQGKIAELSPAITPSEQDKVIDASGLTLLPGVIDPQVHFREPGLEHKEDLFTATCACAKGGMAEVPSA